MSFAQDSGYTPQTIQEIMEEVRLGVNTQFGTTYTTETFLGTNWYKYFYALVQKFQENEVKTSEIFQKLQEYIALTNDSIQRPSVSNPGIIDSFADNDWVASVKPPVEIDAGKIFICVDVDNTDPEYADMKLEICNLIKDFIAAGIVSMGDQVESIVLSNGQSFDFKFALPERLSAELRLTLVTSENNLELIPSDEVIRQKVFDNIAARYRLGWNFEPQRYYQLSDAPWAESVLLEYDIGGGFVSTVYNADFDQIFDFDLEDIQVVIS